MKKVLLIDDERIFHFLSSKLFEVSGIACEVYSAYDGKEALQQLEAGLHPDVILVDLDMPYMDGYEFIEQYKAKLPLQQSTIVVLSSSITDGDKSRALKLGADLFMAKPLSERDVHGLLTP